MGQKAWRRRFPLLALTTAIAAFALLALACEEEKKEATPTPKVTPTVAATPTATPTPKALGPGAAGIPSRPRPVQGLEGVLALDDGLAIFQGEDAGKDRTGVTADSVKICVSFALSGPFAGFFVPSSKQVQELIDRINQVPGAIHGRKINLLVRDDQYRPDMAVTVWKELVEIDKCFVSFGVSGSPTLGATIDYFRANKLPIIQATTGAAKFCEPTDPLVFCTTLPPYLVEGKAMGEYVLRQKPDAKIAIVYENSDLGKDLLDGVRAAVPKGQIVTEIVYDFGTPDLTPHARQAAESRADYLLALTILPAAQIVKALRETVGSQMKVVVESTSITQIPTPQAAGSANFDGSVGFTTTTDPDATDAATTRYKALLEGTGIGTGHPWQLGAFGIEMLVHSLELAGPDLTREGLIEALNLGFDGSWRCSVCLGPTVYGPQDHWSMETLQAVMWSHAQQKYLRIGDVVSYETSKGLGIRGNFPGYECKPGTCPWKEGR